MQNKVYPEIKRRIVLLDYEPGAPIIEKKLAEEFEVSRTPIREALIRLESEGLVRIIPNRGIYVGEVSFNGLKEAVEVRSFLLNMVGKLAPKRVTEGEFEEMKEVVAQMEGENDSRTLRELDLRFHHLLNKATRNPTLANILEGLRNQVTRAWNTNYPEDDEKYFAQNKEEFRTIIQALEEKDGDKLTNALKKHIQRFIEHITVFRGIES